MLNDESMAVEDDRKMLVFWMRPLGPRVYRACSGDGGSPVVQPRLSDRPMVN